MVRKLFFSLAALGLLAAASFPAWSADDIQPPSDYRHWFHVNTMIIDKASPLFKDLGGMHNVYINAAGEDALKKAPPTRTARPLSPTCTTSPSPMGPTWKAIAKGSP